MRWLLDSDILCFKAATAAEQEYHWQEDDVWTLLMDMDDARDAFQSQLEQITNALGKGEILCCFSDPNSNFRRHRPAYKGGGKTQTDRLAALVAWVRENYPSAMRPHIEADDLMSIIQSNPENAGKTIIVSDDKDLLSCPGKLYRPTRGEKLDISEADADRAFFTQVLTGDSADSYPGCPGVGPKTAEKILGSHPSWGAIEQAFLKAGKTKDDALVQARLARILRWSDWDSDKGNFGSIRHEEYMTQTPRAAQEPVETGDLIGLMTTW